MRAILSFLVLLLMGSAPVLADAPPPLGWWVTPDGGEQFFIAASGCRFQSAQGMDLVGICEWQANTIGGVLTLTYSSAAGPQHVYYAVRYVSQNAISVFGDVFYRH